MTAINHALTGAIVGLAVTNPALAVPLAFLSHFALDAVPHYDPPGETDEVRINSKTFLWVQLVAGFVLCVGLVAILFIARPTHWLNASVCAFVATSPDLLSIPRFISVKRTGRDIKEQNWFWRIHGKIQWKVGPIFGWLELLWFAGSAMLLWQFL